MFACFVVMPMPALSVSAEATSSRHKTLRSEHPAAPPVRTWLPWRPRRPLPPTHANTRRPTRSPLRHTATHFENQGTGRAEGSVTLNWPTARDRNHSFSVVTVSIPRILYLATDYSGHLLLSRSSLSLKCSVFLKLLFLYSNVALFWLFMMQFATRLFCFSFLFNFNTIAIQNLSNPPLKLEF